MIQTFTLAHLSDVHLALRAGFGIRHWRVKRLLGYVNWHRRRKAAHLRSVVDKLTADLANERPDHIAVTGDLVNIGLPDEFAGALDWLQTVGPPDRVTVIPGNHDIYVRLWRDPGIGRWRDYMTSNADGAPYVSAQHAMFPFVRRFGRIALVGVNSAVLTPPVVATGRVGDEQLKRIGDVLDRLGRDGLIRVVLIHHPPLPGQASALRALTDAPAFERLLRTHGAELVLHGHNHTNTHTSCTWTGGAVPVIGIASASMGKIHHDEPLGRYNLYRFTVTDDDAHVELVGRGLAEPGRPVVELDRKSIALPRRQRERNHHPIDAGESSS